MRMLRVVLVILYPVLLHTAVVYHCSWLMALAFFCLSTAVFLEGLQKKNVALWCGYLLLNAGVLLLSFFHHALFLLYLPPVVIPLLLFIVFARSLQAGREAVITAIADKAHGPLTPALCSYTRAVTMVWAVVFAAMVLDAVLLPVVAGPELWSLMTNVVNYLVCGALFLGEYYFRQWRYPGQSPRGFIRHIKLVIATPIPMYGNK